MNRFEPTTESIKKPEAQENHETPRSVASPEELRQQMTSEAEKEADQFKQECSDDLSRVEARAEKDGLVMDSEDKQELQGLNQEAENAKTELNAEISDENNAEKKTATQDQIDALEKGKNKITQMQEAGRNNTSEYFDLYSHVTEGFGENLKWINAEEIDSEKVTEMLMAIEKAGMEMKERTIENPELLSAKEASKKLLAEERTKLAQEIRKQRNEDSDRLKMLNTRIDFANISSEDMEGKRGDEQYGKFSEMQSDEANSMAERLFSDVKINDEDAQEERENLTQHISNSEKIKSIKEKLEEHYAKADVTAKENFDTLNRSIEHVMKRNGVFIVHKFEEKEGDGFRHDENYSNVSTETTYADDLDIMLSFEPSISVSSVIPGEKTKLWHGASGFLLGGGQIGEAGNMDIRTIANGIKDRRSEDGEIASIDKIDKVVSKKGNEYMNELVLNNPEVAGFFQHAEIDKNGRAWALNMKTKQYSGEVPELNPDSVKLKSIVDGYKKRFDVATERGIPLYIMTATREVYEYIGINENGTIEIGKQITPEEVATGRAGLLPEKRKEIGERLLEKKVFRKQETHDEAQEIINSL